jgi:sodium transport system permease protein
MNWSTVWVVLKKELVDHLRDKRTATMVFLLSIMLGPIVLVGFTQFISSIEKKAEAREVFVLGAEYAPQITNFFARQDVAIKTPDADFRDKIKSGKHAPVLVIPKDFPEKFLTGNAEIELVYDDTRQDTGNVAIGVIRRLVQGFNREVVNQRLVARGVSPLVMRAVELRDVNMGTAAQRVAQLLFMIPLISLIICVTGCTAIAIDMTAGERERGSMEPLLMNPVTRLSLVTGKWLAVGVYGLGVVALTMAGFAITLRFLPVEKLQAVMSISALQFAGFGLTMASFAPAMGALQMLIATYGRTYKEAQTYVSYLIAGVNMVPMISIFGQFKDDVWQLFVPMMGQLMVITRILRGDPVDAMHYVVPLVVNTVISVVAIVLIAKLLTKEKIIFGRA